LLLICPICSNRKDFKKIKQWGEFEIFFCPNCQIEFSHPMNAGSKEWYESAYLLRNIFPTNKIQPYAAIALKNIPPHSKILDIGCGEGVFVNCAWRNGYDIYGLDLSEEMIKIAQSQYPHLKNRFFLGTLSNFLKNYPEEKFDIITMFELIEHLTDPLTFLREVKDLLKPKGKIIISVPNRDALPIRTFFDHPPNHLTRWNKKSLTYLFNTLDFKIELITTTSYFSSLTYFLRYILIRYPLYTISGEKKKFLGEINEKNYDNKTEESLYFRILKMTAPYLRNLIDNSVLPLALALYPFMFPLVKGLSYIVIAEIT